VLNYLHFSCIFKLLRGKVTTLDYASISPDLPLFDDSAHTIWPL
jgi:hypothetical protein